jgi:hypothetical protein
MCGRYASARSRIELLEEFDVQRDRVDEPLNPDYNVAPTKPVYAVMTRQPKAETDDSAAEGSVGGRLLRRAKRGVPGGRPPGSAQLNVSCGSCAGGWCPTGPRIRPSAVA